MTGPRRVLFRCLHRTLHGFAIPVLTRTGPLEPSLHRAYRRWVAERPPSMATLPLPVTVGPLTFWYPPGRPSFTVRGLAMGTYERPTVRLLEHLVREGMTVLDVGAHIGYYSVLLAAAVGPRGRVWAFEPDPEIGEALRRNVDANGFAGRVGTVPCAVGGDASTARRLYRSGADSGSSSLFSRRPADESVPVEVTTLDAWARSEGWPAVDVVKMDVEGAECAALEGMEQLVRRNPQMALVVELNADALEAAGVGPARFFALLRDRGFADVSVIRERGPRPVVGAAAAAAVARRSGWVPVNLLCRQG